MSSRAVDFRFLLPRAPEMAVLLGAARSLETSFASAGVAVSPLSRGTRVDVIVTDRRHVATALAARPAAVVVTGWPAGADGLRRAGWQPTRYLAQRGRRGPRLLALDDRSVRRYLAHTWSRPASWRGRARNRALGGLAGSAAASLTVATADGESTVPYPLATAIDQLDLAPPERWFLALGDGDDAQRAVATWWEDDGPPSWVLKFSRAAGVPPRGEAEQRILAVLADRSPYLAASATCVVGRPTVNGSEAVLERAAVGSSLTAHLQRAGTERGLRLAERIVTWAQEIGRVTAGGTDRGRSARRHWLCDATLVPLGCEWLAGAVDSTPVVLSHNDLATWNIVTDGTRFTVVDWESARLDGFPLWDIAYVATDVLAEVDGPVDHGERAEWCCRLWRGALPISALLRRWIDRAARVLAVGEHSIGPLVAASWLHHSRSSFRRIATLGAEATGDSYLRAVGDRWRHDEGLGPHWQGFASW